MDKSFIGDDRDEMGAQIDTLRDESRLLLGTQDKLQDRLKSAEDALQSIVTLLHGYPSLSAAERKVYEVARDHLEKRKDFDV